MKDNRTSVKRSLFVSAIALTLTAALLIGTTFAWFTSTAQTSVSDIQAGKLEVQIVDAKNTDTKLDTLSWQKSAGAASNEAVLWEPNVTYKTQPFKVKSAGNLALKYKLALSSPTGDSVLLNNIEFSIVDENSNAVPIDTFEGHLTNTENLSDTFVLQGHMKEDAKNDCQGKTLNNINITVTATQDTVEYDSNGNQYDKNATYPVVYPKGITADTFNEHTTDATYYDGAGNKQTTGAAVAVYIDSNGQPQYVADIAAAVKAGATEIYCNENAKGRLCAFSDSLGQSNRTPELTKDLTIHANGADFEYGELAINTSDAGKNANFTIKVYDAKNLRVWGNTPNAGATQNVILENCTFEGKGINSGNNIASGGIFWAYGETGTINLTMNNCKVSGSDQGVYFGCDGSLTVKDSSFTECATGIKVSYKGTGTRTDRIENCVFTKCGCTTEMAGGTTYLAADSAAIKYKKSGTGTITLTLKSNTITETLGDKGDTQFNGVTPVNE